MLNLADFIICIATVILAMAAFYFGLIPVGVIICIVGGLIAAAPK